MLDKYNPKDFEDKLYKHWEEEGYFKNQRKFLYNDATTKCNWKITHGTCIRWNDTRYINTF